MPDEDFERQVFVNCPYSDDYRDLQRAIIFVLMQLRFEPLLAAQISNSGELRMEKIRQQIRECRHSIHDLSLVIAKKKGDSARMNMPYELGLDLGACWYGKPPLNSKVLLVLEQQHGSVKKALSDHAGFDLRTHEGKVDLLLREIRAHFYAHFASQADGIPADFPTYDDLLKEWPLFLTWIQKRPDGTLRSERDIRAMEVPEFKDKVREWMKSQGGALTSPSPAHDLIREYVQESYDRFIQDAITPWAFFRTSQGVSLDLPNGRKIRYSGIEFSGSPRLVFWNAFPKSYIQEISKNAFDWTRKLCDERNLPPVLPLKETAKFLEGGLGRCMNRMTEIDRRLRSKGTPNNVPRYHPGQERHTLENIISKFLKAELRLAGDHE